MTDLFGLDIAGILSTEISKAGGLRPGTLVKSTPGTRTGGSLTGGTNPTTTNHTLQGFVENREVRLKGQVSASLVPVVAILGASVSPVAVPEVNDKVTIDGVTYTLAELISRDPASALFEFAGKA